MPTAVVATALRPKRRAFYVDATNGNDAWSGRTPGQAWKTLAKVNASKFQPLDQILFKRGERWRETLTVPSAGLPGRRITFAAYGVGANPIFDGSDITTGWTLDTGSNYYVSNGNNPRQVFENGVRLIRAVSVAAMVAGSYFFDSGASRVYARTTDSSNPSTKTMEVSMRIAVVDFNGWDHLNMIGIDVTKGIQTGYDFDGTPTSTDCTISLGTTSWNGLRGGRVGNYNIINNDRIVWEDCIAHDNIAEAFWIGGGANSGCRRCEVYNGAKDAALKGYAGGDAGGILFGTGAVDCFVSQCYVHGVYKIASIFVEEENVANILKPVRTILEHNRIVSDLANVVGIGDQGSATVGRYNVICTTGSGQGILIELSSQGGLATGSTNGLFYGNTLYMGVATFGNGLELVSSVNFTFKNNILIASITGGGSGDMIFYSTGNSGFVSDYNCFAVSEYQWGAASWPQNLAEWRTASGQDANSTEAAVLFTAVGSLDFTLQSGSAARNTGTALGAPHNLALDPASRWPSAVALINQALYGAGYEIGAYAYIAGGG